MFLFAHFFAFPPFSPARNGRRGSGTYIIFISFSFSGFGERKIVIWTPLKKEKTKILSQHPGWAISLSFSPNGRFLASADHLGNLIIWATEVNKKTERGSDHFGCNTIRIYITLFQNWQPVYIDEGDGLWVQYQRFSWLSSSKDVPNYKLAFDSYDDKV
jgi:WD40 repeat protein